MSRLACVAVAKNEAPDITEWIAYQFAIGFDTVIIYDNASTDDTAARARAFSPLRDVRVRDWPETGKDYQVRAYEDAVGKFGSEFAWMAFFDADEFLVLAEPFELSGVLGLWEKTDTAAIGVPWAIFGSSGHDKRPDGLVIESFTRRAPDDFPINLHIKSIIRPKRMRSCVSSHVFYMDGPYRSLAGAPLALQPNTLLAGTPDYSMGKLHHYFTRSRAHWADKMRRGYHDIDRMDSDFDLHDRNEIPDTSAARHAAGVISCMEQAAPTRTGTPERRNAVASYEARPSEFVNPLFPHGFVIGWEHALLGNCLSSFANLFALAERKKLTVSYPQIKTAENVIDVSGIDEVYNAPSDLDRAQFRRVIDFARNQIDITGDFRVPMIRTITISQLASHGDISGSIVFLAYDDTFKDMEIYEDAISEFCQRGNGIIVPGVYWYQYQDMRKLHEQGNQLKNRIHLRHRNIHPDFERVFARDSGEIFIGVHMRRGDDYRPWYGGAYHFEIDEYVDFIRLMDAQLKDAPHRFYVCSDIKMNPEVFSDLPVLYIAGSRADDFMTLARCDYVAGPPSTFGTWSAFLGKRKRIILTKERLRDPGAWAPFIDHAVDVVYPTGSYLPGDRKAGPV